MDFECLPDVELLSLYRSHYIQFHDVCRLPSSSGFFIHSVTRSRLHIFQLILPWSSWPSHTFSVCFGLRSFQARRFLFGNNFKLEPNIHQYPWSLALPQLSYNSATVLSNNPKAFQRFSAFSFHSGNEHLPKRAISWKSVYENRPI